MSKNTNIDEWDLNQCRDFLAENSGCRWVEDSSGLYRKDTGQWFYRDGLCFDSQFQNAKYGAFHPIADTIDEAAKLPANWCLRSYTAYLCHCEAVAEYFPVADEASSMEISSTTSTTIDELLVRFRLRCKIEMEMQ